MLFFKNSNPIKYSYRVPLALYFIFFTISILSCNEPLNSSKSINNSENKVIDSAYQLFGLRKIQQAKHFVDSSAITFKNLDLRHKYLYYVLNFNYFFHEKKDYTRALLYADSVLWLYDTPEKKQQYMPDYDQGFYLKGDVYFNENKYSEAYQYFYQGKLIADKSLNDCTLGDFSYRMGMILYKQGHFRLAAANFKNGFDETGACDQTFGNFYRMQELLNNTALCYSKINETDSAMIFFKKDLDYIDKWAATFKENRDMLDVAKGVIYGNEAKIYIQKNNFAVAKELLKKSIEINLKKGNDNLDAELSELKLVHLYFQSNEIDSMLVLLHNVNKQFDIVKNQEVEGDWNFMMANFFIKKNKPKEAIGYFLKYNILRDSIEKRNKILNDADIAEQIKSLEKNHEFDDLKKSGQLQKFYLKIAIVFAIMLLIIILLILLTWQKSRKNIEVLGDLNGKINEQNKYLETTLKELKLRSQEKDRILRTVAHDLRNPLGGIAALTNAMEEDDYTDDQKDMINLIKETSQNSLELINEILEVTNNEPEKVNKELVEINGLLNLSVELLRFKAAEKNQKIKLDLLASPKEIAISREKIWRVMSNLISNAIKFSPAGGIIYVKIAEFDDEVKISVKDDGIGIPDNIKNKVFNMFTEAKRPGTAGEKSFGLGLSISRQIIENHNGKIWFESEINKGTTFFVTLPKK